MMENKQFEILLERIRIGSYPSMRGINISVDQFMRIKDVCGNLATQVPPQDNKGMRLITEYLLHWKGRVLDVRELERRLAESITGKMTLMESIKKVIDVYPSDDNKDSIIIVHGDNANQKAHFNIFGDVQGAAMAFAALLDNDKSEFKRFIFSLLGVYLAKNPEDHQMFEKGIEMAKQTPGAN